MSPGGHKALGGGWGRESPRNRPTAGARRFVYDQPADERPGGKLAKELQLCRMFDKAIQQIHHQQGV